MPSQGVAVRCCGAPSRSAPARAVSSELTWETEARTASMSRPRARRPCRPVCATAGDRDGVGGPRGPGPAVASRARTAGATTEGPRPARTRRAPTRERVGDQRCGTGGRVEDGQDSADRLAAELGFGGHAAYGTGRSRGIQGVGQPHGRGVRTGPGDPARAARARRCRTAAVAAASAWLRPGRPWLQPWIPGSGPPRSTRTSPITNRSAPSATTWPGEPAGPFRQAGEVRGDPGRGDLREPKQVREAVDPTEHPPGCPCQPAGHR